MQPSLKYNFLLPSISCIRLGQKFLELKTTMCIICYNLNLLAFLCFLYFSCAANATDAFASSLLTQIFEYTMVDATVGNVPTERFELLGDSKDFLTTYTFGTQIAKHIFCKVCGITSFYIRRGSPDKVAITFRCVDPGSLSSWPYDGKNWERAHDQTDLDSCSITADPK
ncbi:hypothetical protein Patl1_21189 [Pistacia atlantica]|uniref:Uncharacterized protein n=1 Tax=Pistacia atlantica TaxID=434234 RepID=A0ACC1BL46_9ROSI|nr:hypothetical protein Patl1_21189 [Pistacia atlantica]